MALVNLEVTVQPEQEPVQMSAIRAWLHLDEDADNEVLNLYVQACRQELESKLRRTLCKQTLRATFELEPIEGTAMAGAYHVPAPVFELPHPPLISITSVSLETANDVFTALDNTEGDKFYKYTQEPAQVELLPEAFGEVFYPWWEEGEEYTPRIQVVYIAGYNTPEDVPGAYKIILLNMINARWYEREDPTAAMVSIEKAIAENKVWTL